MLKTMSRGIAVLLIFFCPLAGFSIDEPAGSIGEQSGSTCPSVFGGKGKTSESSDGTNQPTPAVSAPTT